ncbi:uncharacterized protein LOC106089868 [Stomoxys calcitrans]|uniref:uncharacterized protein LOC106089868 n=1 Tax=Stomoxys calcitrans TaxID=35570 RepID=UPI0027E2C5DE|nr:uncharacterized protein LOC106089868 [Stomoxys calcitrans]
MLPRFIFGIVALIFAFYLEVSAVSIVYGHINPTDVIIGNEYVHSKAGRGVQSTYTKFVKFPKEGQQNNVPISGIQIEDFGHPNNLGLNYLREGGPGKTFATIEIMSQKSKPINMLIMFYGETIPKLNNTKFNRIF